MRRASHTTQRVMAGLPVRFTRKAVKNVNLRLSGDGSEVRISAPWHVPESRIEAFVAQRRGWILERQKRLANKPDFPEAHDLNLARQQLAERIDRLLPIWQQRMGLKIDRYSIRNMRTRWGSCTPARKSMRISLALANYPDACLEYVLVHELAHLVEPSHNPRFHAVVQAVMPDWRRRKALLQAGPINQ